MSGVRLLPMIGLAAALVFGCSRSEPMASTSAKPEVKAESPPDDTSSEVAESMPVEDASRQEESSDSPEVTDDGDAAESGPTSDEDAADKADATGDDDSEGSVGSEGNPEDGNAEDGNADSAGLPDDGSSGTDDNEPGLDDSADAKTAPVSPPVRFLLPTTTGVLLVDVEVYLGDQPMREAHAARIEEIIEATKDEDGVPTWDSLFNLVAADQEVFGRSPVNANQYKEMTRLYDRNRNKRPDPDEVARFVFRNSGFTGPFRLHGTDFYRHINRADSKLFRIIDSDGNRMLSHEELDQASAALFRLDQNSDKGLSLTEAMVTQRDNDPAWFRRRSNRRGEVAMDLDGYLDWTMISYALDGMRNDAAFDVDDHALQRIDQNGDNAISDEEAELIREGEPDVKLSARFSKDRLDNPAIDLLWVRPGIDAVTEARFSGDSVSLTGPSLGLTVRISDLPTRRNEIPAEAFAMLDANSDGYLEKDEIPEELSEQLPLEELDANNDDKLSMMEINRGVVREEPIWTYQVRGRAAEFPDGLFAWLDRNHDHFLSEREILSAGPRLMQDSPPPLRSDDIPDSFVVQISRADPMQDNQTFRFSQTKAQRIDPLPRWASAMDSNSDGDISEREFIGSEEQFAALDADQDGFIDDQEVLNYAN